MLIDPVIFSDNYSILEVEYSEGKFSVPPPKKGKNKKFHLGNFQLFIYNLSWHVI